MYALKGSVSYGKELQSKVVHFAMPLSTNNPGFALSLQVEEYTSWTKNLAHDHPPVHCDSKLLWHQDFVIFEQ